jgi:hypothetical protein
VSKYLITVSTATRHGRTKLHTFGKLIEDKAEHTPWSVETHASRKQLHQRKNPLSPLGIQSWPPPPRRDLGTPLYDELGDGPVHLADGVDIATHTLTVVLDALRSDHRHEVGINGPPGVAPPTARGPTHYKSPQITGRTGYEPVFVAS